MKLGRIKAILGIGVGLAVVVAGGIYLSQASAATSLRYVTAEAGTGDVTQTYTATGAVTRKNTAKASFSVSGTVESIAVAVGDTVKAGDTLAVLNTSDLQLAVLNASTAVAQAEASLYAAKHPTSTASSGGSGGTTGLVVNPAVLTAATSRVNRAVMDEAARCDAILASLGGGAGPTSVSPSGANSQAGAEPSASASPSATASPLSTVTPAEISDADLTACANARAEVTAANANLQGLIAKLTAHGGSTPKKTTSSTKVSKSAVAKAQAALLQAEQNLSTAKANRAKATLVAPISGTVGTVGLTVGASGSSGSITIVGSGNAELTFELPVKTRQLVKVGQSVTVAPAGSTTTLSGKITAIAALATSGTSGDTATYTTTALIEDPTGRLPSGSKAGVTIPVKAVTGVVRVPASAVTPTGTGAATVQVVTSAAAPTAKTTQVSTGAVGGGWVEISSGLEAGSMVVLADNTAEIPANQTNRRRTTTTSTSGTAATTGGGQSGSGTSVPSAQPSATTTGR
ncbi:HlyD family secretion protein [Propionicimonas paludicola]|uniref:HlyD family secretion protein n=1 Tax=Propionicimonas paludicola TaxID=185243 RepID=A0A2A9CT98_9ACTN|nr:biotin/lipoyl-binding protein [Propionicimonas paludicola]PFG17275.1 HlyD family secretion protein [Propionicimonas paludicola]